MRTLHDSLLARRKYGILIFIQSNVLHVTFERSVNEFISIVNLTEISTDSAPTVRQDVCMSIWL